MKLSIIMSVYNTDTQEILEKSIKSILNQTYRDFEFIICDDGSTDNTLSVIKKLIKRDGRVIILKNNCNKGLSYSLNKCLGVAKGEYIARMDADDESLPERLKKQVEFLDKNLEYGLVSCNIKLFNSNGIWGEKRYPEVIEKRNFLFNNPIIHPTIMCRKSEYEKVNYYRDILETDRVEDYDLFMRMFSNNVKMYTLQEYLYNFREDISTYKRRKYKYRINEMKIRYHGFRLLNLYPIGYVYVIKPLVVGLIPIKVIEIYRKKTGHISI